MPTFEALLCTIYVHNATNSKTCVQEYVYKSFLQHLIGEIWCKLNQIEINNWKIKNGVNFNPLDPPDIVGELFMINVPESFILVQSQMHISVA